MADSKFCVSQELLADPNYVGKTFRLGDGRVLSYSECGNLKSHHIVLFHIGLMGSSLATIVLHEQALRLGVRLISLDYPGIGQSTLVINRTLSQWADDVEAFCDRVLGKHQQSIGLLGHCLGGPHVLAVWARLMHRVTNVTLVAPWVGETVTNPWWMKHWIQRLPLQPYVPLVGARILNASTYLNYPLCHLPVASPQTKKLLTTVCKVQAYNRRQGAAGNREMLRLALASSRKADFWDPILREIADKYPEYGNHHPVRIYCGTKDSLVSRGACEALTKWLLAAKCRVTLIPIANATHNSILMDPKNMTIFLEHPNEESC